MLCGGDRTAAASFCQCVRNLRSFDLNIPASHRWEVGQYFHSFSGLDHLALAISPLRTSFRHYSITSLALSLSLSVEIPVSSQTDVCHFEVLVPRLIDGGVSCVHDSILPYYKGILGDSSP